jgi:3-oxoacyl-[acyl-carrier-protein] synthase-1/3-oxoacyl-[acyl-carrier-protein] synthase II
LAVGGGLHAGLEALAVAGWLVRANDADRIVVVAVDDAGPTARALLREPPFAPTAAEQGLTPGAVAILVTASPSGTYGRLGTSTLRRGQALAGSAAWAPGHLALLPLLDVTRGMSRGGTMTLESATPPDALARVEILPF